MERTKAFLLVILSYIVACVPAYFVFKAINTSMDMWNVILSLFAADILATIIVWLFGVIFKNSSFYDPYWSFIPFAMILFVMINFGLWSITNIIFICALSLWSWRLTLNWAHTFTSLKSQDWRYDDYKNNNSPLIWHIINFVGINMMPTLFVFGGIMSGITLVLANAEFNFLCLVGAFIMIGATIIEFVADVQMHRFRENPANKDNVMDKGLWKYSRHPNYFGEIAMWFGVYFFMLAICPQNWYLVFGALAMVALFVFVSIPLAEKRQLKKRPAYKEYRHKVSMLIPLPNKSRQRV